MLSPRRVVGGWLLCVDHRDNMKFTTALCDNWWWVAKFQPMHPHESEQHVALAMFRSIQERDMVAARWFGECDDTIVIGSVLVDVPGEVRFNGNGSYGLSAAEMTALLPLMSVVRDGFIKTVEAEAEHVVLFG